MSSAISQKTAVCFGATSGLGQHAALEFARKGMSVIVVGRDKARAEAVTAAVAKLNPNGAHKTFLVDAFSAKSVVECCDAIRREVPRLHYLVMSQGMATVQGYTPTATEGYDQKLTLHVYSRMLIIESLRELLVKTATAAEEGTVSGSGGGEDVRVISILSGGVHGAYKGIFTDPSLEHSYSVKNAADAAGYYTDLMMDNYATTGRADGVVARDEEAASSSSTSRTLFADKVSFVHHAPGFIATNWGTEMPWYLKGPIRGLQACFGRSADKWAAEFVEKTVLGPQFAVDAKSGDFAKLKISKQNVLGVTTGAAFHTPEAKQAAWGLLEGYFKKAGVTTE